MKVIVIPFFLLMLQYSCNRPPKDVRLILKAAGDNRMELEKVINHYKTSGNKEKLEAAYFLIGNMDDKYAIECGEAAKYDPIFAIFDSLEKNNMRPSYNSFFLKAKWDSLVNANGLPSLHNAKIIHDYSIIKADFLIENIDISFKLREESQWGGKSALKNSANLYWHTDSAMNLWNNGALTSIKNIEQISIPLMPVLVISLQEQ